MPEAVWCSNYSIIKMTFHMVAKIRNVGGNPFKIHAYDYNWAVMRQHSRKEKITFFSPIYSVGNRKGLQK